MTLVKRIVDIVGALVTSVPAAPLMLGVAVLVHLRMGRPVLFRQVRSGRKGEPFTVLKFRTMREAFDEDGALLPDAKRLTRLGRLLRRTSLDELPQLLNVLVGEMSLVGPRPLPVRYVDRYTREQARRLDVKPGLTGWTQVSGRNALSWDQKHALDVWYVDHWSLRLDVRILLLTIWKVICADGISHDSDATMPEFTGSADEIQPTDSDLPASDNATLGAVHGPPVREHVHHSRKSGARADDACRIQTQRDCVEFVRQARQ